MPPSFDADELVKDFARDEDGTRKKLGSAYVLVRGTISKVGDAGSTIYLTPPGSSRVISFGIGGLHADVAKQNNWLIVGKKVTMIGKSSGDGAFYKGAFVPEKP